MTAKNLVFIGGTMGAGKTTVAKQLLEELPASVMLDGDWCWMANPFVVNEETKEMVMKNIVFMLAQFLECTAYQNVIFCWVMDHQSIIDEIIMRVEEHISGNPHFCNFSLTVSPSALTERLRKDISVGIRKPEIIEKSIARLPLYDNIKSVKIDVGNCTAKEAAVQIAAYVYTGNDSTAG